MTTPVEIHFSDPPVVEAAVGVEFLPFLDTPQILHLRDVWRNEFPGLEVHEPLPPRPPLDVSATSVGLNLSFGIPTPRYWFLDEERGRLIQIQRDRLVVNWRKGTAREYPRRKAMDDFLGSLLSDVDSRFPGLLRPPHVEVTYVNLFRDLEPHEGLAQVVTALAPVTSALPSQSSLVQTFRLETPLLGDVGIEAGQQAQDSSRGFLTVSTRVDSGSGSTPLDVEVLMRALETAHDYGVNAFLAATREERHEEWGLLR